MFLSSFEKLRKHILANYCFSSVVDFGTELFDGKVGHNPIVAWVNRKSKINLKFIGVRLVDYCYARRDEKEPEFYNERNRYTAQQENFSKIPGSPIAYWVSERMLAAFENKTIGEIAQPKQGSTLGDNATFLRIWYEVCSNQKKWYPCMKGGEYRKWFGNTVHVVNWENNGRLVKSTGRATIRSEQLLFKEGLTWSNITSGNSSFRYMPEGFFFESTGSVCFINKELLKYLLAFLNTPISEILSKLVNPTLHLQSGDVAKFPLKISEISTPIVEEIVNANIKLSKTDWDSFETSWDFERHPLV